MATHSTVLAWRISGMAEPGGLLSMGSDRVGHNWSDLAAAAAAAQWIAARVKQGWTEKFQQMLSGNVSVNITFKFPCKIPRLEHNLLQKCVTFFVITHHRVCITCTLCINNIFFIQSSLFTKTGPQTSQTFTFNIIMTGNRACWLDHDHIMSCLVLDWDSEMFNLSLDGTAACSDLAFDLMSVDPFVPITYIDY